MYETRARSLAKSVVWRIIGIANSYIILLYGVSFDALENSILMNITGFFLYYAYERMCDHISWGKENENIKI